MFRYLLLEPAMRGRPDLGLFRLLQVAQDRSNGASSKLYTRLSRLWRPKVALPQSAKLDLSGQATLLSELDREGCALLPYRLPEKDLDDLRRFAFSTPAYGKSLDERIVIDPARVPTDQARYQWRMADLAANAAVQRVVLASPFAAIAQDYLGCRPYLSLLTLWLNPAYPGANDQFVYHYDNDGPRFLKFFIYLTDMDLGTGAHFFIRGSQSPRKPAQFARSARYDADALLAHYGKDKEYVARGPAGTILAEDTMGFHRGSAVTQGYRLLFQLEYSIAGIVTEEDLKQDFRPLPVQGLDANLARIYRKFWRRA